NDEKMRYDQHNNHPDDPDYRLFLSRLTDALTVKLTKGSSGLDYGCGPGPTLSVMLEEEGFKMTNFDPFFAAEREALAVNYDFICCSETVEHFFHPGREFELFNRLLRKNAWLAVMTSLVDSDESFCDWWYHRDPTHVCFYRKETMRWIADKYQWTVEFPVRNLALFHRTV
ncbi:MAG: class I SAM-dependent methyltransferase, partial [Spirochaetota bacterium]|nr:class I SAM-dependent methyltransferase [Spirochaetota bacterium]